MSITLKPELYITWVPMGVVKIKPLLFATIIPADGVSSSIQADTCRNIRYTQEANADTYRNIKATETITADTLRELPSPTAKVEADTVRNIRILQAVEADTFRQISVYQEIKADTNRQIFNPNYSVIEGDTERIVKATLQTDFDTCRKVVKRTFIQADTSARTPFMIEYVDAFQNTGLETVKALENENIADSFRNAGIKSFSVTLGESTISDTIQFETVYPLNINDSVKGQFLNFKFDCLVEETSQKDSIQAVKCMYDIDKFLYTEINFVASDYDSIYTSYYLYDMAQALGLKLYLLADDYEPNQNYTKSGMTYKDLVSALLGWTSKLPHRQVNAFIRGDTLHVVQRGQERNSVDITNWPHTRPTVSRKLIRSLWNSTQNGSNKPHNEEDVSPIPFTGTISFGEISYTYNNGYLIRSSNEDGYTTYSYAGEYLSEKRTHNKDGSTALTEYVYGETNNEIYLVKERERTTEKIDGATDHDEYDWTDWNNENGTERITYHAPVGYGWYATTVYIDGELEGSALSQGKPGSKASRFTIDQSNLSLGSHFSNYEDDEEWPYTAILDTEFPVKNEDYLAILTNELEWLNRKTQEEISVDIISPVVDGVPEIQHIVDFTEKVVFDGSTYYLVQNQIDFNPREFRQRLQLVRWY